MLMSSTGVRDEADVTEFAGYRKERLKIKPLQEAAQSLQQGLSGSECCTIRFVKSD
jgi:hypothetical protein